MKFEKGKPRPQNSGRKKGSGNKVTADIRDMIRSALDKVGGQDYLTKQAVDNPTAFMTLIGKVVPAEVNANVTGALTIEIVRFGDSKNTGK